MQHVLDGCQPRRLRDGALLGRGGEKTAVAATLAGIPAVRLAPRPPRTNLAAEASALMRVRGMPNLLQLLGLEMESGKTLALLVERAPHGSMLDLADELEFQGESHLLTREHVESVVEQVSNALTEMKSLKMEHGDVRAANVLVFGFVGGADGSIEIKLGDFGCARPLKEGDCVNRLCRELCDLIDG